MKRSILSFFLLLSAVTFSFADNQWPSPQGYVNDLAQVIPADQKQTLENFLGQVEQQTGSQIAVVTIPSVDGGDIDGAAVDLFKKWGIGQKGKDNGVLILAAIQDRKMRIEVGYGLESVITDGTAGDIIRENIRPQFRQGDYGGGLTSGAAEVAQLIAQSEGVTLNGQIPVDPDQGRGAHLIGELIVLGVFLLFIIITRGWGLFFGGGFYGGGRWGGGGFGGSSGGGGFGGFGGGGSGGGGASGGW
jgi:uncharacterized protein